MRSHSARRSAALFAGLAAAGALVLASAPAAMGDPAADEATSTPTASTTAPPTPTETESATASTTPATTTEKTRPSRTTSAPEPAATSAEPTPSSTPPPTSAAPTAEGGDKAEEKADVGGLTVWTGPLALDGAPKPGTTVSGRMEVQVEDTRPGSTGWNVDVKTTDARGSGGGSFTPGADSYYRAADTACSTATGIVPLTANPTTVATTRQSCEDARWTSDVGIAVPTDVAPDNYTLTITHSVY